jgi:predicted dehydrogenase
MSTRLSRRRFLQHGAAGAAATVACPALLHSRSPNEQVRIAAVGVGGKGWTDLNGAAADAQVVAYCDVATGGNRRGGFGNAAEKWPAARAYTDWREMLDNEHQNLDGVTVSTPDHMHAPITLTAIKLGLGTYTQKPLTRTVHEARQLTIAAREAGVATQMGNQHHNGRPYQTLVQLVRDGAIGKIRAAHGWSDRPIWPQGILRPAGQDPVPETLHWDLWLGVAPQRPYLENVYHPFKWRGWFDFGAGALGDMGCHIIDPIVWALDLPAPRSVRYEGPEPTPETFPTWERIHYRFPGTDYTAGDSIDVVWHDGGRKPPEDLAQLPAGRKLPSNGTLFVGTEGTLVTPHGSQALPALYPEEKFRDYRLPELAGRDHYRQWTDAIRGAAATTSSFAYAGPLTETVLLGTIAARVPDVELQWDTERLQFTNSDAANQFVRVPYRRGWEVYGL